MTLVLAFFAPGAAHSATDSLCPPLRAFAASIKPNQVHEIVFRTSWGGGFKDMPDKNLAYAARCDHFDYGPGKPVCDDLIQNGSVEFANFNAMRALECLAPRTRFGKHTSFERGEFSLMYGTENRGANMTLSLDEDRDVGGMKLRIEARGY